MPKDRMQGLALHRDMEKKHCWVNKGAKGIALIDDDTNTGLKYVFDISDVHKGKKDRTLS